MFLNLPMLLGISAVGVPIVIHLLNRRKYQRVVWAAMRFLRVSVEQNQRRMQIEDIVLLICRCALVALLAIALARPVLRSASAFLGQDRTAAVVILDNSYSMSLTDGVESRFSAAKRAAEAVIKSMPEGSSVAVFLGSDIAHPLIPEPTFELALAANAIKEAALFDRPSDLLPSVKAAVETLRGRPAPRKEIYLITDGQVSAFRQMDRINGLLEEHRKEIRAHLLFVGKAEDRNLGLSALSLDGGLVPLNQPVRLEVAVRNYGRNEARDVNVSIAVGDDPSMDQATISAIPPGEERSISLFARFRSEGYHVVTAKIESDHLPADDSRAVAVRAVKDVKVLLIDGDSGRQARESETFFLKNALRPVPRVEWEEYFIKITVKSPTELEAMRFEDFDAVMAANVTDFSANTVAQLGNYLRSGGALWIFPGDGINQNFYNEQLYKRQGILPAALGQTRGDAKSQDAWFALSDKDYTHPVVSLWKDPAAGMLSSAKFFKAYELVEEKGVGSRVSGPGMGDAASPSPEPRSASRVVLRFADGKPALMERDWGQGRVLLFASTADTEWNDVPARAGIFIPLVHRALRYSAARQDERLTVKVGSEFVHNPPLDLLNKDLVISKRSRAWSETAKDLNEMQESRRVELVDGAPLLQFNQVNFAGAYEVKSTEGVTIRFAAQSQAEESSLEALSEEQYQLLGEFSHVLNWAPNVSLEETIHQARIGSELWLPLCLLVAALAAAEMVLAHWFSRSK